MIEGHVCSQNPKSVDGCSHAIGDSGRLCPMFDDHFFYVKGDVQRPCMTSAICLVKAKGNAGSSRSTSE